MKKGTRIRVKSIDDTGYLYGNVTGKRFGKILVLLDEYKATDYEFDREKLEIVSDEIKEAKTSNSNN